jgi:hypothetical protein
VLSVADFFFGGVGDIYLQLFIGQSTIFWCLLSLVSYIFNAFPTTVVLTHLLFALQIPFRNDGSGFHCTVN